MSQKISESTMVRAKADIVGTISKYLDLKKNGTEYQACCPFHKEKSPSFSVVPDKGMYYCFGCGAGGNAIDFVMAYENLGFPQAVKQILGDLPIGENAPIPRAARVEEKPDWLPIVPVPADNKLKPKDIFNRKVDGTWQELTASKRWTYLNAEGQLIGYISRFEKPEGGKEVLPQAFCVNTDTGEMSWRWTSFSKPRPMYGLDKLAKYPDSQVMVVEGEKAADAGQQKFLDAGVPLEKLVVVSWPGGGKAVKFVDWSPLAGRSVGLWPDSDQQLYVDTHAKAGQLVPFLDQPGTACMLDIYDRIADSATAVKFVVPPAGLECGWDLADEFPEGMSLMAVLKASTMLAQDVRDKFAVEPDPEPSAPDPEPDAMPWDGEPEPDYSDTDTSGGDDEPAPAPRAKAAASNVVPIKPAPKPATPDDDEEDFEEEDDLVKNKHFTVLGYDGGDYYLFSHAKKQVMRLRKGDISDIGLIEYAPLNWWEFNFPAGGKTPGINKPLAAQWIFATAHGRGIYDPTLVRGRGVWTDKGRFVFHHGAYLSVDGVPTEIAQMNSAYVYPMARRMPEPAEKQLTDEEGENLVAVADMVRWTMPASGALMAGFVMLAPICGALKWRPHIWINGGAGSGKTTIQRDYCQSALNGLSVYAQGNSTEPGIRQRLRADALPVLLDEAESNNEREKQRIESILSLIRQSSSESQAETLKGTVTGDSMNFHIRSMFCLSSINTMLDKKADTDRLTRCSIRSPGAEGQDEAHWELLKEELHKMSTDLTLPNRLMARAINMLPVIMESIEVFTKASAKHFGTQREGDQLGTLLAGCWCLQKSHVPSVPEAMVLIKGYDWAEHTEDNDQDDSQRALESILNAKIRLGSAGDLSVYELVREAHSRERVGSFDMKDASATLVRHGIRVKESEGLLLFGTSVPNLKALLVHSAYSSDVRGQLLRLPGATKYADKAVRFNGSGSKCVAIPLTLVLDGKIESQNEIPI